MLDSKLFSKMSIYCSAFIFPSTSASLLIPSQPSQPHTMIFHPPNLTVPWTSLSINPSPVFFHTHCLPSDAILLVLVSSDQITLFQSSTVHSLYFKAKFKHFFLCIALSNGFFFFITALETFPVGTLSNDRLLRASRKLRGMFRRRDKSIKKDILEYSGGKQEDVFLLSRGDGVHCGIVEF